MRGVLVTNADQPLGRRIVKRLLHDSRLQRVLALGRDPEPAPLADDPARALDERLQHEERFLGETDPFPIAAQFTGGKIDDDAGQAHVHGCCSPYP